MPQAVQIETQAEQQGLAHLHGQAAARSAGRELAFDRGEDTLDQRAAAVESARKRPPHFGTHAAYAPSFLSAFGRDHALRSELLTNVGMISFAVEFRIGQYQSDGGLLRRGFDDGGQIRAVVPRTSSGALRQQKLLIQIRYDHPLRPMPPRQRFLSMMVQAAHEKRADRSLCQSRGVHAYAGSPSGFSVRAAQPAYGLADRSIDGLIIQSLQKTIQRSEIGYAGESECLTQFAMFPEPHLGFAKGPVFVAHQTENGQQLRLGELVFAETAAVARKHRFGDLQGDPSEGQESDFGHRTSCLHSKQRFSGTYDREFSWL